MFGDEEHGGRLYGIYEGFVFSNDDPDGRGRIRVTIPGLVDEPGTAWADQKGSFGRKRGTYRVPPNAAPVLVQFINGDPDRPVWEAGPFYRDEEGSHAPSDTESLSAGQRDKVQTLETDLWAITLDEREEQPLLTIRNKVSGDLIEFDGKKQGITIQTAYMLRLLSDTMVEISAPGVKINGRMVTSTSKPI